jgi:hypothetical protein
MREHHAAPLSRPLHARIAYPSSAWLTTGAKQTDAHACTVHHARVFPSPGAPAGPCSGQPPGPLA